MHSVGIEFSRKKWQQIFREIDLTNDDLVIPFYTKSTLKEIFNFVFRILRFLSRNFFCSCARIMTWQRWCKFCISLHSRDEILMHGTIISCRLWKRGAKRLSKTARRRKHLSTPRPWRGWASKCSETTFDVFFFVYLLSSLFLTAELASHTRLAEGIKYSFVLYRERHNFDHFKISFESSSPVLKSPGNSAKRLPSFVRNRVISIARSAKARLKRKRQEVGRNWVLLLQY